MTPSPTRTTALSILVLSILVLGLLPAAALAQPPGPPTGGVEVRAVTLPGGRVARLATTWAEENAGNRAELLVDGRDPIRLQEGHPVVGSLAVAHGLLVVALGVEDPRTPFEIRTAQARGEGLALGDPIRVARPGGRRDFPFAVAVAETPTGFAVFFQEVQGDDPSAAHTYLLRLGRDGRPDGAAVEVPVPWSLAAAAWNGHGYHLALIYPGGPNGMRLSMVSITGDGRPEQHPDWASAAGYVADVHLVSSGDRIRAFFRGGREGGRILEADVTRIRGWGSEPPAARDHGAVGARQAIALARTGNTVRPRAVTANGR